MAPSWLSRPTVHHVPFPFLCSGLNDLITVIYVCSASSCPRALAHAVSLPTTSCLGPLAFACLISGPSISALIVYYQSTMSLSLMVLVTLAYISVSSQLVYELCRDLLLFNWSSRVCGIWWLPSQYLLTQWMNMFQEQNKIIGVKCASWGKGRRVHDREDVGLILSDFTSPSPDRDWIDHQDSAHWVQTAWRFFECEINAYLSPQISLTHDRIASRRALKFMRQALLQSQNNQSVLLLPDCRVVWITRGNLLFCLKCFISHLKILK